MGHKVHPIGIRLGVIENWSARWYADPKNFADTVFSDLQARAFLEKELAPAGVSRILIERPARNARFIVRLARPGVIMRGGAIERLAEKVSKIIGVPATIVIEEVQKPDLDAKLVAEGIAQQLERRIMFRRAMKRAVTSALRLGAGGIKICVAGRLGGTEIARTEWYREGRVPLHTFRARIDYGVAEAKTTYGIIGVKVWIYKGEVFGTEEQQQQMEQKAAEENSSKRSPRKEARKDGRKEDRSERSEKRPRKEK